MQLRCICLCCICDNTYITSVNKVLKYFPLIALPHRSTYRSLSETGFTCKETQA